MEAPPKNVGFGDLFGASKGGHERGVRRCVFVLFSQ
jgi:hypothetical protein